MVKIFVKKEYCVPKSVDSLRKLLLWFTEATIAEYICRLDQAPERVLDNGSVFKSMTEGRSRDTAFNYRGAC